MKELRLILDRQLSRLEAQRELLDGTIAEVRRRYTVLEDVDSWNLLAQEEITLDNGMNHHSGFEELEVESSDAMGQEEEPEPKLRREMEDAQTFDASGLPLRARDMFKKQTLPA